MYRLAFRSVLVPLALVALASPALAAGSADGGINSGDTAWLLISTALVMLMVAPGLALFYGGLVGQRNVLSTLMHSFFMLCLISIQWVVLGYTLTFGSDHHGLIGGFQYLGMNGVGAAPNGSATIPHILFAMYQGMFAIITPALISGAVAGRMRFQAYALFTLLWATCIYDPLAHWVWGGGWLQQLGALDFAGGLAVHVSSGVSALVAALVVGRRRHFPARTVAPHNIPFVLMGGTLLWFGWFGFNAGSALAADGLAATALATTMASGATGGLVWSLIEARHTGKPSVVGTVSGSVAGLVGVTPAAGYVTMPAALIIGASTAFLCYLGVTALKERFGYDDTLDVFGVHGLGGIWGAIVTGLLANKSVNAHGMDGLVYGNPRLLSAQVISVLAAVTLAVFGTLFLLKIVGLITPLRVSPAEEEEGLDLHLHGETAYGFIDDAAYGPGSAD